MRFVNILAALLLMIVFDSCKKDKGDPADPAEGYFKSGTWRITNFMYDNVDRTSDFAGYTFAFSGDGKVNATKDNSIITGNWTSVYDIGNREVLFDERHYMTLYFLTPESFSHLSGQRNYEIVSPDEISWTDLKFVKN
jgi:hypothetical protein